MKRLLLLATTTGYQTTMFREAAERAGIPLALATDRCHVLEDPWRDGAIAVRFQAPHESAQRIVAFAREAPLDGMVAVGDLPTAAAALASRELGLPYHPVEAVEVCRSKFRMRQRYSQAGLNTPWFTRFRADSDPVAAAHQVQYPCVLKPLELSGSRGVVRANAPDDFVPAFRRIQRLLDTADVRMLSTSQPEILVEGYIPGIEVAIEGLMTRGTLSVLAIFDKPDPLEGPYFEETIYVTPSRLPEEAQREIVRTLERAVEAVGLWHGPLHAELRWNEQGAWMLEMAARPIGGLCARALRFSFQFPVSGFPRQMRNRKPETQRETGNWKPETGISLEELILRHAAGEPVGDLPREAAASGVMMIPIPAAGVYEGVEGTDEAERLPGIDSIHITAKFRQKIYPMPEGASYLGFIFARGETPAKVEHALRQAHAKLRFAITAELPVV